MRAWGLMVVAIACLASAACSSPQPVARDAFVERAEQVVDAWNRSASETAWRTGFVPLADLTFIDYSVPSIYRTDDEDLQGKIKVAIGAAAYRLIATDLPGADGEKDVTFPDGTAMSVPVIGAADAFDRLRRGDPDPTCSGAGCTLTVTGARLAEMRLATSRGKATVPAWAFTVTELTVPVMYVAVAPSAIAPLPEPSIEIEQDLNPVDGVTAEGVSADGVSATEARRLIVHYTTGACLESHTAMAYEATNAVVVGADAVESEGTCTSQAVHQKSEVELATPLGDRVLLDAATGRPIVYGTCGQWQISGC